jgi:hypothetical protein
MGKKLDFEQILTDVSAFIPDGIVDFTNPLHVKALREALVELNLSEEFINELSIGTQQSAVKLQEKKPQPKPKRTATQHRPKTSAATGETGAAKQARQKGLEHIAFSYYGKNGEVMFKSSEDKQRLVPLTDKEKAAAQQKTDAEGGKKPSTEKGTEKPAPQQKVAKDPAKSPVFNQPVSPNKQFYAKNKGVLATNKPFVGIDSIVKNPKYPKKYNAILERMMNISPEGDAGAITFYTEGGGAGAGTTQSKAGEIASMMFVSMTDKEFDALYPKMLAHVDAIEKSGKKVALEKSWLESARDIRNATLQRVKKQYPGAQLVGASWDVPEEVEALGMPYGQKEASTDVFYKVRLPNGKEFIDQSSLKKDAGAALLNPGAGIMKEWDEKLPKDVNPDFFYEKRRNDYLKASKMFFGGKYDSALGDKKNKVAWKEMYGKILSQAEKGDKKAKAWVDYMEKSFTDWNARVVKEFQRNPKMVQGVLRDISEALPIKGILSGKESITIGNTSFDKFTAQQIFGTNDFNLIKTRLVVISPKDGPPYLSYRAGKNTPDIPVAKFRMKDESGRYSVNAKFILDLHKGFADAIKAAHKKVYGQVFEGVQ